MTESQWLTCATPKHLLARVVVQGADRNARLFGCACCRRV
jgi:hypothetical protein